MKSDNESPRSRVALVTGAAGRIGRGVAAGLAAAGWKVAGIDRRASYAELSIQADVRSRTAVADAAAVVADRWGRIELLVTAAADCSQAGIGQMSPARWQKMLDLWLGGTANACAAVLPEMVLAGFGSIVVLTADVGSGGKGQTYVAAASGTLTAFVKSLGIEMADRGVCVNCLALKPGVNPEWVAGTVRFLADEGRFYAGQVMSFGSHLQS
jgi:3-oxoacyl-[acyl-carrier protein] reductase